jgi:hypothetical protein
VSASEECSYSLETDVGYLIKVILKYIKIWKLSIEEILLYI